MSLAQKLCHCTIAIISYTEITLVCVCVCVVKKIIMSVPNEYSLTSAKSVRVQPANPEKCDGVYYWPKKIEFYLVINYF